MSEKDVERLRSEASRPVIPGGRPPRPASRRSPAARPSAARAARRHPGAGPRARSRAAALPPRGRWNHAAPKRSRRCSQLGLEGPGAQVVGAVVARVDVGQLVHRRPVDPDRVAERPRVERGHLVQRPPPAVQLQLVGELGRVAAQEDELAGPRVADDSRRTRRTRRMPRARPGPRSGARTGTRIPR